MVDAILIYEENTKQIERIKYEMVDTCNTYASELIILSSLFVGYQVFRGVGLKYIHEGRADSGENSS